MAPDDRGLYCAPGGFWIDPWRPVERAVITHAHGDHARPGSASYLAAAAGLGILIHRLPKARIEGLPYGETRRIGEVDVSFHPAGHVLGSAQVRVEHRGEVWVVSGDYKRQADPTCAPFEPIRCHTLITEATFALPIYRWEDTTQVAVEIAAWWRENADAGRASVLCAYSLGKAQRLLAELLPHVAGRTLRTHAAIEAINDIYRSSGVHLPPTRRLEPSSRGSLAGELILAPPAAFGSLWMRRIGRAQVGFASGWMLLPDRLRRGSFDRGFVVSDHADWEGLLRTVEESGAERVLTTHGYAASLARFLGERGIDAAVLDVETRGRSAEAAGAKDQQLRLPLPEDPRAAAARKAAGIPGWLFDECSAAVGHLAETVALLPMSGATPSELAEPC